MKKFFAIFCVVLAIICMTACSGNMNKIQNSNVTSIFIIDGVSYDVMSETFINELQNNGWKIEQNGTSVEAYKEIKTTTIKKTTVERYSIFITLKEERNGEPSLQNIVSVEFNSKNFKASNLRYKDLPLMATSEDVIMTLGQKYSKTEDAKGNVTSMIYESKSEKVDLTFDNGELTKLVISKK